MPLAVTHILSSIIVVDLFRDYVVSGVVKRRLFSLHTVFLAGFFGLLPDIDVLFQLFAGWFSFELPGLLQHGGVTHTPFFGLIFVVPGLWFWHRKNHRIAVVFFVACFAIFLHIFLDYLVGGGSYEGIMWLFPFSGASWKVHLVQNAKLILAADAVILLAWLYHEEVRHKISDFI